MARRSRAGKALPILGAAAAVAALVALAAAAAASSSLLQAFAATPPRASACAPASAAAAAASAPGARLLRGCFFSAPSSPAQLPQRGRRPRSGARAARGGAAARCAAGGGEARPQDWVAQWIDAEVAKHPVVLFSEASNAGAAEAARAALRKEAGVQFEAYDVDMLGFPPDPAGGGAAAAFVERLRPHFPDEPALPALFVGGRPVAAGREAVERLASSKGGGALLRLCKEAGAAAVAPAEPPTNMSWTSDGRIDGRWQVAKNLGGRRWFADEPGMAMREDEHLDPARIEYNIDTLCNGAGTDNRGRFTGAGKALLRLETNLDLPDKHGKRHQYAPFTGTNLITNHPEFGHTDYIKTAEPGIAARVGPEEEERYGLPRSVIAWVYRRGKKRLEEELMKRQCRHKIVNIKDTQNLREALFEELRKERDFSPSGLAVAPGIVQDLSAADLEAELAADSDVVLLVALVAGHKRSPVSLKFRKHLQAAAKRLLRAARVVKVDCLDYPEVARDYKVARFPTLLWLEPRTGEVLAREAGYVSASHAFEVTRRLREGLPVLPELRERPLLAAGAAGGSRVALQERQAALEQWASIRGIKSARP